MKKKLGMVLAVVATAVIGIVSLVGCAPVATDISLQETQAKALMAAQRNLADCAIVDGVYAGYTLQQEGNSYDKLQIAKIEGFNPEAEFYGVAAKKGETKLMNYINKRLYELSESGEYMELLNKYGLASRKVDFQEPTGDCEGWENSIINKTITIGFTVAPPYGMGDNDNPSGFDFDLAKKVFGNEYTIKGKIIEWSKKFTYLGASVDLIWNGMTIYEEFKQNVEISVPYMGNEQVIVIRKDLAEKVKTVDDMKDLVIAVETASAGNNEACKIFSTLDKAGFNKWLDKYPEQKATWMNRNPEWK